MARLLRSENVVNIENIITVFVVVTIILTSFARFGKDSTWIPGGLVFECRITYSISRRQVGCEGLKGLGIISM